MDLMPHRMLPRIRKAVAIPARIAARLQGWGQRILASLQAPRLRRAVAAHPRLHLGCGYKILADWVNVDSEERVAQVVPWDLTLPMPLTADTISHVYSEHFIEHLPRADVVKLLADCHRCLKPGGVLRLSTPDLAQVVESYRTQRLDAWIAVGWQPATPCQMVNEALSAWGHRFLFDEAELLDVLRATGFREVRRVAWGQSEHVPLRGIETRPACGDLIVEAIK